ncbi:unnamed protein product [Paramecium sonneborni]|uniref:Uncharacterized protein n=1 Tax=Paramecium sonneborni TaxID=65129 RepID=A0A8S1RDT7_9CILI|nr:unnamed protein product [Paramecium sonneborni]
MTECQYDILHSQSIVRVFKLIRIEYNKRNITISFKGLLQFVLMIKQQSFGQKIYRLFDKWR